MTPSSLAPIADAKAGLSSMCRGGDHGLCMARCACPCHGKGGQQVARPKPVADPPPSRLPQRQSAVDGVEIGLVWEEPPAPTTGGARTAMRERYAALFDALRERPEQWARIAVYPRSKGANSGQSSLRKKPPAGRWEFRAVSAGLDGKSKLYARYMGEE